jgi:hypothetical protein
MISSDLHGAEEPIRWLLGWQRQDRVMTSPCMEKKKDALIMMFWHRFDLWGLALCRWDDGLDIKQGENETLFDFQSRFEGTLYHIPESHRPEREYVVHYYTHAIWPHLGLPLRKRAPKTLDEAYGMAKEIKNNIFSSGINDLFTSGTLTMESLYSHENLVDDFQEEGKQTIVQHETIEDMAEETKSEQNDEVSMCVPPSDEVMQEPVSPMQQSKDEVSYFPLQNSNDTMLLDSKEEEEIEALDEVEVPCCAIEDKEEVHGDEETTHAEEHQSPQGTCTRRNSELPSYPKF